MSKIKAIYVDHMGSDKTVVNAARESFNRADINDYEAINDKDISLIKYLARGVPSDEWESLVDKVTQSNDKDYIREMMKYIRTIPVHFVPFAHPHISIVEHVPITVARQRAKHQIGFATSEFSRRYKTDNIEVFEPDTWRNKPDTHIKQGSGVGDITLSGLYVSNHEIYMDSGNFNCTTILSGDSELSDDDRRDFQFIDIYNHAVLESVNSYNKMLQEGVAPELARGVLPLHLMTKYRVTGSLYAFANAYIQRSDNHAQKEIQDLAKQWDEIIRPLFPISWAALVDGEYD